MRAWIPWPLRDDRACRPPIDQTPGRDCRQLQKRIPNLPTKTAQAVARTEQVLRAAYPEDRAAVLAETARRSIARHI